MSLQTLSFKLFTDAALTIPYTGLSLFQHQSDLSDAPEDTDTLLHFGSLATGLQLRDTASPGVSDILITPIILRVAWQATTAYALGDSVVPTTPDGFRYEAVVAGTSGSSEPTFPSGGGFGSTVVDGTVTWEKHADVHPETEIKLATTDVGLDSAVGGVAYNIGNTLLSGLANKIEVHFRITNTVTQVTDTIGIGGIGFAFINSVTESNV
jgi:hypothetical protein